MEDNIIDFEELKELNDIVGDIVDFVPIRKKIAVRDRIYTAYGVKAYDKGSIIVTDLDGNHICLLPPWGSFTFNTPDHIDIPKEISTFYEHIDEIKEKFKQLKCETEKRRTLSARKYIEETKWTRS